MNPVTREEVFKAADQTAVEGIMPSIIHIRELLEHRGSESTIGRYLKEWKILLLKKNGTDCLWCDGMSAQLRDLSDEAVKNRQIIIQLKEALTVMLENPDRQIALEQVLIRLQ